MEQILFFLPRTQSKQSFLNDLLHLRTDICNMLSLRNSVLRSFFCLFFFTSYIVKAHVFPLLSVWSLKPKFFGCCILPMFPKLLKDLSTTWFLTLLLLLIYILTKGLYAIDHLKIQFQNMCIFIILAYTFISQGHLSIIQNFYMNIFFVIISFTFQETFFFFFSWSGCLSLF